MVTNGLSPEAGDDADTTRKALAKEVGRRDLTDPKEWSAQPLAMVTNGLRQVVGGTTPTRPGRRWPKKWEACPCRRP